MDGSTISEFAPPPRDVTVGKIGPNSVIQLGETVIERLGREAARALYRHAQIPHLLDDPPDKMIEESVPAALFKSLWQVFPGEAKRLADEAGQRTADYIIAHRIPGFAQKILRFCPKSWGARLLLKSIKQNAWTFAGSGQCDIKLGRTFLISIRDNPLAMPECAWHRAVLERLFDRLVAKGADVRHVACCSKGAKACRFEIALPRA